MKYSIKLQTSGLSLVFSSAHCQVASSNATGETVEIRKCFFGCLVVGFFCFV